MKNKKHAYDYLENIVTYKRPLFHFPDLSSENGNPYNFWPLIYTKLNELGFRKEAKVFSDRMGFMKYAFKETLQLISFYLDFNPENEADNKNNILKEDSEYVYIKVKKELYSSKNNLKQPSIFKIKDIATFREMMDEDFSIKNCYGRTFLHYIDDPVLLNCFLNTNFNKGWVNLIDLDNFNGSYLHSATNFDCFAILFKHITDIDPLMSERFLFETNCFNQSGYGNFINLLNEKSQTKETFFSTFSNEDTLRSISQIFILLQKVNHEEFEFLKNQFQNDKKIQSYLNENVEIADNFNKLFLLVKLENNLSNNHNSTKNKNKI